VLKKDCLDLPPLVKQRLEVKMPIEQRRMYKQMKDHFITYLGSRACVAQLALTKALRLMQIVSGFVKLDNGKEETIKNERTKALSELLVDLVPKHKVIVWACFRHNYKQIAAVCRNLGVGHVQAHGGTTAKDKELAIEKFMEDDETRVFIGNQGAMGIGVNLTVASYCVYFSRSFSLEHDLQSEARNHRGGSEIHEKITRIDLVCPDTIDDLVLKALANKEKMGEQLLQAMKEHPDEW
jgi:SNF2 family DNA or RNA helicase